jgi:hypothetical protein
MPIIFWRGGSFAEAMGGRFWFWGHNAEREGKDTGEGGKNKEMFNNQCLMFNSQVKKKGISNIERRISNVEVWGWEKYSIINAQCSILKLKQ